LSVRLLHLRREPIAPVSSFPAWYADFTVVGVTGTNGKTSTTAFVAAALGELSRPVARTSTIGCYLDDELLDLPKTPESVVETLRRCHAAGGRHVVFEVTSEVLARGFARACPMQIGVFTNLTHDHLDAHGSPEHYLASKAQLFMALPDGGTAVLNACDASSALIEEVTPKGVRIIRYGVPSRGDVPHGTDLVARTVTFDFDGTEVTLDPTPLAGSAPPPIRVRAIGDVYAENALAAVGAALAAGVPLERAAAAVARAEPPPGRFELVWRRPYVIVDYAHSPDALARTVASARTLARAQLVVVFGAGGHRDREKRPKMGEAARAADRVLLTSDNPRDEDPAAIAAAIREGLAGHSNVETDLDRRSAIRRAVLEAAPDDVIVVAGRGHETEQIVGCAAVPFSDKDVALAAIRERGSASSQPT
jgi:UDP-N-acetylmuramoyl-L-alanyl-D-glutamate--2,6-diaminopimelate ligase